MSRRPLDEEALTRALRTLADAERHVETPAHVEDALMARWDAAHAPRGRSAVRRVVRVAGAMAAGVTLVGAVAFERELATGPIALPQRPALSFDSASALAGDRSPQPDAVAALFAGQPMESSVEESPSALVLVGQPIADDEVVHVVRMRVTRASLRVFGVAPLSSAAVSPPRATEMVDIDVVVGEDGVARGVRVPL
jgi:hypothetical protein